MIFWWEISLINFALNPTIRFLHCYPHIDACNAVVNTTGILTVVKKISKEDAAVILKIGSNDVHNKPNKTYKISNE